MKIIFNSIIPFKGFVAINILGFLFARKEYKYLFDYKIEGLIIKNHESIHTAQMKELGYIFFYLWYLIEWIIRLFQYGFSHKAYRNISFEREAYTNEKTHYYLDNRKHYSFLKYLRRE